jgi:hypothetical protein
LYFIRPLDSNLVAAVISDLSDLSQGADA